MLGKSVKMRRVRSNAVIVDLQVNQGAAPWPVLRDAALAAEDAGFDTLWSLDHFSGEMFGSDSMLECFSVLSAWAAVTSRIGLGTLVANVVNRHPGLLASAASTVQAISGGRLTLGLGAGAAPGTPWASEHDALGIPLLADMAERHRALVRTVQFLREVWAEDRDERFRAFPRPVPIPPIIVGVNSESLARTAGSTVDGMNVRANHPRRADIISAAIDARGGRPGFDVSVWTSWEQGFSRDDVAALEAEGVTRVVLVLRGTPDPVVIGRMLASLR